jgi:hypothetical protein
LLRNCTIGLGVGSTIEGCLQIGVGMFLRTPVVTIATTLFITSLQTTMLASIVCPQRLVHHPLQGHDFQICGGVEFCQLALQLPSFCLRFHKGDFGHTLGGKQ